MKTPNPAALLSVPLVWEAVFAETCSYRVYYQGSVAKLLINSEFPAGGPFYRLCMGDAWIEFDDPPPAWTLPSPPNPGVGD